MVIYRSIPVAIGLLLACTAPARGQTQLEINGGMVWGSIGFQADTGGMVNSSGVGTWPDREPKSTPTPGPSATIRRCSSALAPPSTWLGIGTLGMERINNVGNRWTMPIMGGIYVKF